MTAWYDRKSSYDPSKVMVIDKFDLHAVSYTDGGLQLDGSIVKYHYEDKETHGYPREASTHDDTIRSSEQ